MPSIPNNLRAGILCCLVMASAVGSDVAPITLTLRQPNGSAFQAKAQGNQYVNWIETLEGHTIIQKGKTWHYGRLGADGELEAGPYAVGTLPPSKRGRLAKHLRPKAAIWERSPITHTKLTAAGDLTVPVLVIMVSFSDIGFAYSPADFHRLFFNPANSVRDFYLENTFAGLTLEPADESAGIPGDGIIRVQVPYPHPNIGNAFVPFQAALTQLVKDAMSGADPFIAYQNFDDNTDGRLDPSELAVVIIAAGYENAFGGSAAEEPRVWAHVDAIPSFTRDGVQLAPYMMAGERHAASEHSEHRATIGIMCHELGHLLFGLPDLYDRDGSSAGVGQWALMGSGTWAGSELDGNPGDTPAHFSAWSKVNAGIVTPQDIYTTTEGAGFPPSSNNAAVTRLWIDPYGSGEHFLIENRQQTGYDVGLPGAGLLIWHVDPKVTTQNDNELHKLVDLEESDAAGHLDLNINQGDVGDPFPGPDNNERFDDLTNPASTDYEDRQTHVSVERIQATDTTTALTLTADLTPAPGPYGRTLAYDEGPDYQSAWGDADRQVNTATRFTNLTSADTVEGLDLFSTSTGSVQIQIFEPDANPLNDTPLFTGAEFPLNSGWNRLFFDQPHHFPAGTSQLLVARIHTPNSDRTAAYDAIGYPSGNAFLVEDFSGHLLPLPELDWRQRLLLSGQADCAMPVRIDTSPIDAQRCMGTSIAFQVKAAGTPEPTYQWRRNGVPIPGAVGRVYRIGRVSRDHAGAYDCLVTNICGTNTSDPAVLTVREPLQILEPPADAVVCPDETVSFTMNVSGEDIHYQWRKNGSPLAGENSRVLMIPQATRLDAGVYDCLASDACGSVMSPAATLQVQGSVEITRDPVGVDTCEYTDVLLSVEALGDNLTYQWRHDGIPIIGAEDADLFIPSIAANRSGSYDCVISSDCGELVTDEADVIVEPAPRLLRQPLGQRKCPGDTAVLRVAAEGPALTYQWRKNGQPLSGQTEPTLSLPILANADTGFYTCVVSGPCGETFSRSVELRVENGSFRGAISPATVPLGLDRVVLRAETSCGFPEFSYKWSNVNTSDILGYNPQLTIFNPPHETTVYRVEITDLLGHVTTADMTVLVHPVGVDLNGDGQNSAADLFLLLEDWQGPSDFDADGDQIMSVIDMLHVRVN